MRLGTIDEVSNPIAESEAVARRPLTHDGEPPDVFERRRFPDDAFSSAVVERGHRRPRTDLIGHRRTDFPAQRVMPAEQYASREIQVAGALREVVASHK